jgi:hypothetical protein
MSPRKTILRELSRTFEQRGDKALTRPARIPGFQNEPDRFQKAVNRLLQERLVEGRKDDEGYMALALNGHRLPDVARELRPAWTRPVVWATVVLVMIAVGAGFAI